MKKLSIISVCFLLAIVVSSCGDNSKPGLDYMPDMKHSRAYETYADHANLSAKGVFYNNRPVAGTVSRGEELPYHLTNDSAGYAQSAGVADPLPKLNDTEMQEAERLFIINCAICHGPALDGNGPLYNNGNGPYPAVPKNLTAPDAKAFSDGHYFFVITNGIRSMGSYASQLRPEQRWWV